MDRELLPDLMPGNSRDLLSILDRIFPPRCIILGETPEAAHRYAGTRELIDELLSWQEETYEAERSHDNKGGGGAE